MPNSTLFEDFRKTFFYAGFWSEKQTKIFKLYSYVVLLSAIYFTLGFALETMNALSDGLDKFGFNFGALLTMIVAIFKIIITSTHRFQSLLTEMFKNEEYISNKTVDSIRENYCNHTKMPQKIVKFYKLTMVCTLTSNAFLSIFMIWQYNDLCSEIQEEVCDKPLLFPYWVPFNTNEHYVLTNFYLSLVAIVVGIIVVASDLMVLAPILYLSCRLKTLKHFLKHPHLLYSDNFSHQENCYRTTRHCVMEHQAIIEELKNFNSMTKYLILCDFLFHSTQIAGFAISLIASASVVTVENILTLACGIFVFFQLFIVYWHGQILIDESETIPSSLCQSEWYKSDVKTRRLIILMMMRSKKPLALTVGPFFLVNLEVFLKIVKTVYSITALFFKK